MEKYYPEIGLICKFEGETELGTIKEIVNAN